MVTLANRGKHRSRGIRHLLIAAIAEHHGAAIIDYSRAFGHIAAVTGQSGGSCLGTPGHSETRTLRS